MKAEYTKEDFARAVKNPFFEKLNTKVNVAIRHETYDIYKKIGDINGVEPELLMRQCLEYYAKKLEEHE